MLRRIREGIAERIYKQAPGWNNYAYVEFSIAPQVVRDQYFRKADEWLGFLHSQGVGIKGHCLGAIIPHLAAYYTFEPLVEEE